MKRAFTLIEAVVVVAIVLILAAILMPTFGDRRGENAPRASCQSNLKQIGLGLMQYSQDYNAVLPATHLGSTGWVDAIQPYVKSWQLFQCPSTQGKTSPSTDYFFNVRLSRGYMPNIKTPVTTILSGDGEDDAPAWASLRQLPPQWIADKTSPAWRHQDGANYGFADGHVKWLKPDKISNTSPSKSEGPTFAVR